MDTPPAAETKRPVGVVATLRHWFDIRTAHALAHDELAEAKAFERWLLRHWWKLLPPFLLGMAALALSLHELSPNTTVGGWFWVVLAVVTALALSFSIAYFGYHRYTRRHSGDRQLTTSAFGAVLSDLMWGAFGTFLSVTGALVGIGVGSGKSWMDVITDTRLWALLFVLCAVVAVIGLITTLVANLRVNQADLELERATLDAERARLARRNAEAELKLMQAQVEPHFLYNTLANLRYLVQSHSPQALAMTDHLIDYLRVSLPNFRDDLTTLGREIELIKAYLAIMEIRTGGKLRSRMNVPSALERVELPPLVLLTLIENAVKHGIARSADGGEVCVGAAQRGDRIEITVADTGVGFSETPPASQTTPKGSGVGLANIRERLKAVYGEGAQLALASNRPRGVVASIRLPLRASTALSQREAPLPDRET